MIIKKYILQNLKIFPSVQIYPKKTNYQLIDADMKHQSMASGFGYNCFQDIFCTMVFIKKIFAYVHCIMIKLITILIEMF